MQNGIYFWLGAWKLACEGWGKYEEIGKRACTKVQAKIGMYTHALLSFLHSFLAVNHHNYKDWVPSILTHNLCLIFMGMKQFFFFLKKKIQNGRLKKRSFFKIANSQYFLWKFYGLVLGLVGLNDAKGIDLA